MLLHGYCRVDNLPDSKVGTKKTTRITPFLLFNSFGH